MAVKKNPGGNAGQARQSARGIVRQISTYTTPKEGVGVVKRISSAGNDSKFIQNVAREVRAERGVKAAKKFRQRARKLDATTMPNRKHAKSANKAARTQAKSMTASKKKK